MMGQRLRQASNPESLLPLREGVRGRVNGSAHYNSLPLKEGVAKATLAGRMSETLFDNVLTLVDYALLIHPTSYFSHTLSRVRNYWLLHESHPGVIPLPVEPE
jgi:hypothetical protein